MEAKGQGVGGRRSATDLPSLRGGTRLLFGSLARVYPGTAYDELLHHATHP